MKSPYIHLILVLIICTIAFVTYGMWYATVAAQGATLTNLQNQVDSKIQIMNHMTANQTALTEITEDETVVQSYFISETGVVAFINDLETRGHSLGATVSVLSVSSGTASTQSTLAFTLSIKGTFDAVMRTVGAIEYAPYALALSSLSVGQDAKGLWHADLIVSVDSSAASTTASTP